MQEFRHYDEFIEFIKNTRGQHNISEGCYFERHHIEPRYKGGEGDYTNGNFKKKSTHPNCIYLYADEHYLAHKLYALDYPDDYYAQLAWEGMAYRRIQDKLIYISESDYKEIREALAKGGMSEDQRAKISKANTGKKPTEETRKNLSAGQIRRNATLGPTPRTEVWNKNVSDGIKAYWDNLSEEEYIVICKKFSESHLGYKETELHKKHISEALTGKKKPERSKEHKEKLGASHAKKVRCIDTGEIFNSIVAAEAKYGGSVGGCCNGKLKTSKGHK